MKTTHCSTYSFMLVDEVDNQTFKMNYDFYIQRNRGDWMWMMSIIPNKLLHSALYLPFVLPLTFVSVMETR